MADCNAVAVRSSFLVINRTFTLGGVDGRARLFIDHRCVNVFIHVLNFPDLRYFCIGSYKYNVVADRNKYGCLYSWVLAFYGCLLFMGAYYREFTVIHKTKV